MRPWQRGRGLIAVCGFLLLLFSGVAAAAVVTDSPIVISKIVADGDRMTVTLLNTAPYPVVVGGWMIAAAGERAMLPAGTALAGLARTNVPMVRPAGTEAFTMTLGSPEGETMQVLEDPAHVWVAGDVFSLHGVDRYRYIVVYTRDTEDGLVHGCYEVDLVDPGRYEVSQYIHGQEVFGDAFIAEQGGRFIENVPLDEVVITDDTPADGGKTYFGLTLGKIFGAANAPLPTTPKPVPTAPHWPTPAPVQATTAQTVAPTGTADLTQTPAPAPTATATTSQPVATEPTPPVSTALPVFTPATAPVLEPTPEPVVTSAPVPVWGKRFAAWQAPSTSGRRVAASVTPEAIVTVGAKATRPARSSARVYPRWSPFARATLHAA